MKALLDTNIIIHRESSKVINQDIGVLFKWLDKANYQKCIHPVTISEIGRYQDRGVVDTFKVKMESYHQLNTVAPMHQDVEAISKKFDTTENDKADTVLLNELYQGRIDILISEDKKIHLKAAALQIDDQVYSIESFLEKIAAEHPALVDYKVLNVRQEHFGNVHLDDPFFDSFKEDYPGFEKWFNKKSEEKAYVTINNKNEKLLSFLYLKVEDKNEPYPDIEPAFTSKKRLKIGTFKVISNGFRLGERFLKVIFDNALVNHADEVYVTIFDRTDEQKRLISLLETWGFVRWGIKTTGELVYVRDFSRIFNLADPRKSFPFISRARTSFLVPIYPQYHTELFPDSILRTESPMDFIEGEPHRNGINKVYVSRSIERNIQKGDILIFYRTGGVYKSVITTICLVDEVLMDFENEDEFVRACRKRSVFSEDGLRAQWRYRSSLKPFIVSMLYVYSFPKRANLSTLIEHGVIKGVGDAPRGFTPLSPEQFETILKITNTDESFIVD